MKILQVHVFYTTSQTSGENSTVENISTYFASYAHAETLILKVAQKDIGFIKSFQHYLKMFRDYIFLIQNLHKFDVVFFHNQVPFIPAFFLKFSAKRTCVVKVWHNLRPFCIKGSAFRANQNCWKCSRSRIRTLNALLYRCYRNSFWQTLAALVSQSRLNSILKSPNIYNVTVSDFLRDRLITHGFDKSRVFSIQNAISNLEYSQPAGNDFIFMGRITEEKGIEKLLSAWVFFQKSYYGNQKLHIVGDGPLLIKLRDAYQNSRTIFHGHLKHPEISQISRQCKVGVIPNLWEEPFGKVALDFLSMGLLILASRSGGISEILSDDSGTEFISSMEPELLAEQMMRFSLRNQPINYFQRENILQSFSQEVASQKWFQFLDFLTESNSRDFRIDLE